jgi:hypothetical protein
MKRASIAGLAALLALAACGRGNDRGGGLSEEEERQLDNAAAMLDDNVFDVSPDSMVANEAEIAAEENAADANVAAGNASANAH